MISILIPTYNYDITELLLKINKQINLLIKKIDYEIIVVDDCSSGNIINLNITNNIEKIKVVRNETNKGRSWTRNKLVELSNYENLLFLDSDTLPIQDNFILSYVNLIHQKDYQVVYGGILYQPNAKKNLRLVYGNSREALSVEERNKNKYLSILTLNILLKKSVFEKIKFNEEILNFRHEDTLFSYEMKKNNIKIEHIHNPVYHLGVENSEIFLLKSEESVIGIKELIDKDYIPKDYIKLTKMYDLIKKYRLRFLLSLFFVIFKKPIRINLLGKSPSLFLFDVYRLCHLNKID